MTAGCSSPVVKSTGGKTDVASGRINIQNTSLSVYPDADLQLVVAESSLVTSYTCLIILSFTLRRAHLYRKFMMAEVLIKKTIPRMAEVSSCGERRNT
jgi:hypothetical protein